MNKGRLSRALFRAIDIFGFPPVDLSGFSPTTIKLFNRRKVSLELYHRGESHQAIFKATQRTRKEVGDDIKRFLTKEAGETIYGWAALIPGKRLNQPENPNSARNKKRRKNVFFARGSFTKLLAAYPLVKTGLDNVIRGRTPEGKPRGIPVAPAEIHARFIDLCHQAGLTDADYPLVTEDQARRALRDYRNRCLAEDPVPVLKALYGPDAARELLNATGRAPVIAAPTRLYQRIEVDGHALPFVATIELPGAHPLRPIIKALRHITLVFVVECGSAAILGYSIRYGQNYSSRDVLRAIRRAILPWQPLDLDPRLGIRYPEDGGLPSGLIPELAWALWRELHWDNFRAHLTPSLIRQLPATTPVASPVAAPDTHAVIEAVNGIIDRFFKNELCGTANGLSQAVANAEHLGLTAAIIEQIIDVAVATYNALPPAGTNISKIGLLRRFAADPRSAVARIPEALRPRFRLYDFEAVVTINGSKRRTKSGPGISRPYFRYHHGDYTLETLARRFDLIGQGLMVRGDSDDLRRLDCWLLDGTPFGQAEVLGPWQNSKHGFETRSIADQLRRKGKLMPLQNPVEAALRSLQRDAASDSRAALMLARLMQETGVSWTAMGDPLPGFDTTLVPESDSYSDPFPDLDTLY